MKFLVVVVLILVGAYFFPQVYEEVGGPCQALEKKVVSENTKNGFENTAVSGFALALSSGDVGQKIALDQYPNLPVKMGCVAVYYNFPDDLRL